MRTRHTPYRYFSLFFLSGFAALLYQVVWQRALFTFYGVNIESVTLIVTAFMIGLGFGSIAGGRLSRFRSLALLGVFGAIECGIGLFGIISLRLFERVATWTASSSPPIVAATTLGLLLVPTLLMAATLPLLAAHFVRETDNVGESVGILYCVNTLGSALACVAAATYRCASSVKPEPFASRWSSTLSPESRAWCSRAGPAAR